MAGIVNKVWKMHRAPTQIEGLYALMFEFRRNLWEYGLKVHIIAIRCDEFLYKNKINDFLPEMLCIVVLAAENDEL